jgi:Asp-tRNA(Asn)/Glu-tRNA(Gln) amidotransferase A subunit family amidase
MPLSFSLDYAEPLTWTIEDAAIVLQAIAGRVPDYRAALASSDLQGVRLGIPRAMFERDCPASGAMGSAFDAAVEVLRGLGAAIAEIKLTCRRCCRSSAAISTRRRCCASVMPNERATPWRARRPQL